MSDYKSLPSIREVIEKYKIWALKSHGQNFIFDLNVTDKIVSFAGKLENKIVIEVGPGPGGLTRSILKKSPEQLIAIDKDKRVIDALEDYLLTASEGRLNLLEGDILKINLTEIHPKKKKIIISNLPYNISSQVLFKFLDQYDNYEKLILMFQKEVAERITASPGNKSYGRLSVLTQMLSNTKILFDLKPEIFIPKPKVTSSVVAFEIREKPLYGANIAKLKQICNLAFQQRRKKIGKTLSSLFDKDDFVSLDIDADKRPEQLTLEEFARLSVNV